VERQISRRTYRVTVGLNPLKYNFVADASITTSIVSEHVTPLTVAAIDAQSNENNNVAFMVQF
jgi:hypothetical protein